MQNLMLNRLAPISNPKMKNQIARVLFYNVLFHFETNFFPLSGQFWKVGKFLSSRSEAEKLAGFAYQPPSKVPSFIYGQNLD